MSCDIHKDLKIPSPEPYQSNGYETWSLTLREEYSLRMKTGFRGEYLRPRGMRMRSGEGSTMRNFIVCTVHLI
jgi:hypothetical protein